ncbi:MAG: 4-hydroxy-tetrahydrodipicolinate reductase [Elusimicrobiota bacterium]|jgi:4-hydroxy-tetrahydrodipicolinate reductase|nr:4-hydroxy-tetrahydrodipicolinate reductase [Elusimicrobiota bacterium]
MKISVFGAAGRMGQKILSLAKMQKDIEIAGALEIDTSVAIGSGEPPIIKVSQIDEVLNETDVFIDFTNPVSTLANAAKISAAKKAIVIGTTGFTQEQKDQIKEFAKVSPIVLSPNMSVGVNVMFSLVKQAALTLPDYDTEIIEMHHNKKKDSPSGTAAKLAEIIAQAHNQKLDDIAVYERRSVNRARTKEEIGIMSVRAGGIVGDHSVLFAGGDEIIEIKHRADSRDIFAIGALRAAQWLFGQKAGLYDMQDVLDLK